MAACLPFKGSIFAHQFDRHSDIDQRSEQYGLSNSFLHYRKGLPHHFKRRTRKSLEEVLLKAAKLRPLAQGPLGRPWAQRDGL
eukprot:1919202-Pleurochrysis_carterae.AAC.1